RQHLLLRRTCDSKATTDRIRLANWLWHCIYRRKLRMITDTRMLYLYAETPLHAGVGSGLSSIDLPIQRERSTQYPMVQGSGIKGKLRATAEEAKVEQAIINILFGASIHEQNGDKSNSAEKDYA